MNTNGTDFAFKVEDSWGNQAMVGIKESVRRFEDLPLTLPSGLDHSFDVITINTAWDGFIFRVYVNGVLKGQATGSKGWGPIEFSQYLYASLITNLLPDPIYRVTLDAPNITIWRTDDIHATITVEVLGWGDGWYVPPANSIIVTPHTVVDFTGVVFAVKPDPSTQNGTYYVRWNTLADDGKTTSGNWEECPKKGMAVAFDPTTMPHRLVRMPDGNFVFAPIVWAARGVGDEISAPDPTFVGNPIQDVFFFKNRLGLLSKGSAVFSRAGEFFDFFPSTATDVLDDDPIDAECSSKQVAVLRYGLPFQTQLVLFSDQQQFTQGSGEALFTPKSATGDLVSSVSVERCEPVAAGPNIYFASPAGEHSTVREMFVSAETLTPDSADVTAHAPSYVPLNIKKLAACPGKQTVFAWSSEDRASIYVYKYYWNGDEKAQSAWGKWTFSTEVLYMDVIDNYLYILTVGAGLSLDRINLETKVLTDGLTYRVHLDKQLILPWTYAAGVTSFTSPYAVLSTDRALNLQTGACVDVTVVSEFVFSVPGDWSGATVIFGRPYELDHRFSEFGMKSADPKVYSRAGRGQLRTMNLSFEDTMSFDVVVETVGRAATTQRFRASVPVTGEKRFVTLGDTRFTRVSIKSDSHLPCKFGGASYETMYAQRSK